MLRLHTHVNMQLIFTTAFLLLATTVLTANGRPHLGWSEQEMNRKIVLTFYQSLFGNKDLSAIDKYIDDSVYIQHNPTVADGKKAFRDAAAVWLAGGQKEIMDIRRSAADGDLVWLHVKSENTAVIDIFRLNCGKIVEHWDVIQEIPAQAANSHPMF